MFFLLFLITNDDTQLNQFQEFGQDIIIPKIDISGALPKELLQFLADQSQLELVMLEPFEQRVELALEKVALPAILDEICRQCGACWAVKDQKLYVGSKLRVKEALGIK